MLKFLIITILIFYLIYRLGGFFFRMLFTSAYNQQQRNYQNQQRHQQKYYQNAQTKTKTPPNSNVKVDYVPQQEDRQEKKGFNGGQYVDYEEVK